MTTERILPAIALPAPGRLRPVGIPRLVDAPRPVSVPRPRVEAPAHAAKRKEALLTTPARACMLVGASAAVYAVGLAGVAALQSGSDAELAAQRQPYLDAVAATRAANDRLEAALTDVGTRAEALSGQYAKAGETVSAYEARLDALAALVAEVQGSAAALPTRISLPSVTVRAATRYTRAPATTAKSGASGGG